MALWAARSMEFQRFQHMPMRFGASFAQALSDIARPRYPVCSGRCHAAHQSSILPHEDDPGA
jgi:hypothetical protein